MRLPARLDPFGFLLVVIVIVGRLDGPSAEKLMIALK